MSEKPAQYGEQMKSKSGLVRIWHAFIYSRDGLWEAVRHEHAFRQELTVILPLLGVAVAVPVSWRDTALLCASLFLVLIVELLNSAMESCVDHISLERHPLAKRAKDMGSAAVLLSIITAFIVWITVLLEGWR